MTTLLRRDYPDLSTAPLYRLQAVALDDEAAARECARRFAWDERPSGTSRGSTYLRRLREAWLDGLYGEQEMYARGRGGNFCAPFRRAYAHGRHLRIDLLADRAAGAAARDDTAPLCDCGEPTCRGIHQAQEVT